MVPVRYNFGSGDNSSREATRMKVMECQPSTARFSRFAPPRAKP